MFIEVLSKAELLSFCWSPYLLFKQIVRKERGGKGKEQEEEEREEEGGEGLLHHCCSFPLICYKSHLKPWGCPVPVEDTTYALKENFHLIHIIKHDFSKWKGGQTINEIHGWELIIKKYNFFFFIYIINHWGEERRFGPFVYSIAFLSWRISVFYLFCQNLNEGI